MAKVLQYSRPGARRRVQTGPRRSDLRYWALILIIALAAGACIPTLSDWLVEGFGWLYEHR